MSVEGTTRGGVPGAFRKGATFGGFRIERTLGHGGMGIVYLATELRLERQVALKVIRTELAGDDDFRARFRSESLTAASVEHPHVVTIFGAGERDGLLYVAMRYVPGRDLGRLVAADGALPPNDAAALIGQVADGLDAVHAAGLVHRDVKPHNVIVGEYDDAYLTDFGLAKAMAATTGLTATGQVIGTVDYMAPEQIEGQRVDARTDVYALGGVLFHAITGRVPFDERESSAKMWAHVHEPPPSTGGIRAGILDPVIRRAMAKDPIDRYPSAGDLGRAAIAATRGEAVTEPEHVVGSGEAAPLPETVRLSRDPALPPTDPRPRPRRPSRVVAFVLALLLIAGLGTAAAVGLPDVSRNIKTATAVGATTATPDGVTVPSLVGQPLDVAQQRLDELGLHASEESTGIFGVLFPSDWDVCETSPAGGSVVSPGSTVKLVVDRPDTC